MSRRHFAELSFVVFMIFGAVGYWRLVPAAKTPRASRIAPKAPAEAGRQIVLVYIGSSSCPWSNDPLARKSIEEAKVRLATMAERNNRGFVAVGIATDRSTADGLGHLAQLGRFDEISVGNSDLNGAILKYMNQQWTGPPATPSLVILDRAFVNTLESHAVTDERLLGRYVGVTEIANWLKNGSRLAPLAPLARDNRDGP